MNQKLKQLRQYIEDQILTRIQRRCEHPSEMVAHDILEGGVGGLNVAYCRRCGAVKTNWHPGTPRNPRLIALPHWWRTPDPNLWRGR